MKNLLWCSLAFAAALSGQSIILQQGQSVQLPQPPDVITWTVNPQVGSVSNTGLYTAPSQILAVQTITVTSSVNGSVVGSYAFALQPSTIALPIEVGGLAGATNTTTFPVPATADLSGPLALTLQVHNLKYETEASVQFNNGAWTPLNTSTLTLTPQEVAYGGIGGGFNTITATLALPTGTLSVGLNTMSVRFNGTDGFVSYLRVLAFNISDAAGKSIIPANLFVQDAPVNWQPPLNDTVDIAAGKVLFQTQHLTSNMAGLGQARCGDCHAADGRDLKYFNYSNTSIVARSQFHGLTFQQGQQIASYIRSLPTPAPPNARPWNPPYQPGAGLDEGSVVNWSAGAGLSAVLSNDAALMSILFPGPPVINITGDLNTHETPLSFPLPDWNSWLPTIHPLDAWPTFGGSGFYSKYSTIKGLLSPGTSAAYTAAIPYMATWESDEQLFMGPLTASSLPSSTWTPAYNRQVYSTLQWAMVKSWEINQTFGLEAMGSVPFPTSADQRAWYSGFPFLTSPNMLHIPAVAPTGLGNGSLNTRMYLAEVWYQTQLILNHNKQQGNAPIDWGYVYQFVKSLSGQNSTPQAGLFSYWLTKGLQISNNGIGPDQAGVGWNWIAADISRAVSPGYQTIWTGTSASTRTAISTALVTAWLTEVQQFTPQQFWTGGYVTTRAPVHGQPDSSNVEDRIWYMIPQFRYYGVPQNLINQLAAWAQTIWTATNWTPTTTATCVPDSSGKFARCSTEQ